MPNPEASGQREITAVKRQNDVHYINCVFNSLVLYSWECQSEAYVKKSSMVFLPCTYVYPYDALFIKLQFRQY